MVWKKVVPANNPKQPEVTQEDREAADPFIGWHAYDHKLVHAFAAYRIATRAKVLEEAEQAILDIRAANAATLGVPNTEFEAADAAILQCHAAIRAMKEERE